jgi:hypothetical protein
MVMDKASIVTIAGVDTSFCRNWLETMTRNNIFFYSNLYFYQADITCLQVAHTYNCDHLGDGSNKLLI